MRDTHRVFKDFTAEQIPVGDASIFVRHGDDGPPALLLHGHPRTSETWHRVAPALLERGFQVICPDLRGYGRSRGPTPSKDLYADPVQIWKNWAHNVRGQGIDSTHHMAEEAPEAIVTSLADFFST